MLRKITSLLHSITTILLGSICFMSCIYDYNPKDKDLPGLNESEVVVDGDIIVGGITKVTLSLTKTLGGVTEELPSGITLNVESESGDVVYGVLVDEVRNVFEIDTRDLDVGGRYRLYIAIPDRGEYVSEFKQVMVSPPIDEITWSMADDGTYVNVEVTTHNSSPGKLYCKWNFIENWESHVVYTPFVEFNPRLGSAWQGIRNLTWEETLDRSYCWSEAVSTDICITNTEKLSENIISKYVLRRIAQTDTRVSGLYSITVSQKALDKDAYIYWETLQRNMGSTGGIFAAQPTDLRGNIRCETTPEERVIGYVSVTTQTQKRHFVDWEDLKFYKSGCRSFKFDEQWNEKYTQGYRVFAIDESEEAIFVWWSYHRCVDCRVYSNSTKPDFWPK